MTAWVPDVEFDVVLVASLCGLGFVAASLLWHLHVRPDLVLSLWRPAHGDGLDDPDPHTVGWLRWALGGLVFFFGFLAGAALSFLTATR